MRRAVVSPATLKKVMDAGMAHKTDQAETTEEAQVAPPVEETVVEAPEPAPVATPIVDAPAAEIVVEPEPLPEPPSNPPATEEPMPGPSEADVMAVEDLRTQLKDLRSTVSDMQTALSDLASAIHQTAEQAQETEKQLASGAEGKRWIPKEDESKEHFIERARSSDGAFDLGKWEADHGAEIRKEFPGNFGGEGW